MATQKKIAGKKESNANHEKNAPSRANGLSRESSAALTQIMLDSTPLICAVWDDTGQLIDCNQEMLRLLKINDKAEIMTHFFAFSPERQSDGEDSKEKGMRLIRQALKSGHVSFNWEYKTSDGEVLPTATSLVRVKWGGGSRILAYSRDKRELNKAKEQEKLAEERMAMMLNTLPLATYIISDTLQVIDCNEAAVRLFGAKNKEHLVNSFLEDFSPKFQPGGELSYDKAKKYILRAFTEGRADFEWVHRIPNGELIPAQITLIKVLWHSQIVLSAYAQDLREVRKAEKDMRQRANFLRTVNTVAEWLLPSNAKNVEDQIEKSMEFLARSMNINGIKIWMNTEQNGELYYSLYKSWPPEDAAKWPDKYAYNHLPFWKDSMLDKRPINSFVSDLPRAERAQLDMRRIKSVLAIPLQVEDELWGFISFEDWHEERVFTDSEEQTLISTSSLIISTIVRNRAVNQILKNNWELRKKSLLLSSVNRVAELILGSEKSDLPLVIQRALKLLGESVNANRASLWVIQGDAGANPASRRLTGWQRGKDFSETRHNLELKLHDYVPEWNVPIDDLRDVEFSIEEMNDNLKRLTILQGSKTLLLIPLVLQDRFWGYVGIAFEDGGHRSTEEERSILRSGSMMIAEASIRQDISEMLEQVEEKAAIDHLTGLQTRASFLPKAQAMFMESRQDGAPCAVLFLDIDFFKKVNDRYGHAFGDVVLARFADIIKRVTRPQDLCCRYGGEEAVIVLADGAREVAEKVAERILHSVREARFDGNDDFTFTVSIGFISAVPQPGHQLQTYLEQADLALYAAKSQGRNRIIDYATIKDTIGVPS